MGRSSSRSEKDGMKKGVWTAGEDEILVDYVKKHGQGKWGRISKETGLRRCGKSVRLRWLNYLRPDIKRGNIAEDEEELIIRLHKLLGNRWSLIAGRIPGRTDNEIKNYWNSTLRRKLELQNPIKEDDPHSTSKNVDQPTSSSFTNHNIVKEEDPHHLQPCHHLGSTTTATDTTTILSGATIEANNKNDVKLTVDVDLGDDDDDATWNDFIMDLNQAQLDITEFLQTDFSKLCESASTPPMDGC